MCRISVLKFNGVYNDINLILPLLDIVAANGESNKDGTGISILDGVNSKVLKSSDEAKDFLWQENVLTYLMGWNGHDLFGHVRISTVGRNISKDENSHPFDVGDIIGMHNGHFNNYYQVKAANTITDAEVDSHVFYKRLAQLKGDQVLTPEIINKTLEEFTGNFALAMYEKKTNRIFLIPGHNDLNLYKLPYGYLVNTSASVTPDLNVSLFKLGITYQRFLKADAPTKLESFKIYELTTEGTVILADAVKGKEPEVIETTTRYFGSSPKEKVYINGPDLVQIAQKQQEIMDRFGIGIDGLVDFIEQMHHFSPIHSWKFVTVNDLEEALNFLTWLYPKIDMEEMKAKTVLWNTWTDLMPLAPYAKARSLIPGFEIPYFLNSKSDLEKLLI